MILAVDDKDAVVINRYQDNEVKEAVMDIRARGYSVVKNETTKSGNILMWVHRRGNGSTI